MYARNYGPVAKWLPSVISDTHGSAIFVVKLADGRITHRLVNT